MNTVEPFFATGVPRLVMFDLDGTLVDSVHDLTVAVDSMLTNLDRPPAGIEQVRQWIGNGVRVLVRRALANGIDHSNVGEEETATALVLFMEAYADSHSLTKVYPGVVDTLKWLRKSGVEIALITNKPERFIAPLLDEIKLGHYFRWIIGGDTLPQQKPDPTALLFVMKMAGVGPDDTLFVGDSRNDILAAKAAGVRCVGLTYGYNHGRPIAEETPTLVIDDLRELLPCTDQAAALVLTDTSPLHTPTNEIESWVSKLWIKIIKARMCWRWCA